MIFLQWQKLFADDTSLSSVGDDVNESMAQLNNNLKKISKWTYQWKMTFNPDISKQTQEVLFSWKSFNLLSLLFSLIMFQLKYAPSQFIWVFI